MLSPTIRLHCFIVFIVLSSLFVFYNYICSAFATTTFNKRYASTAFITPKRSVVQREGFFKGLLARRVMSEELMSFTKLA